jgi:hypothetical protein
MPFNISTLPFIGSILNRIFGIIDKVVPDGDLREKLKTEIQLQALELEKELISYLQKEVEERVKVITAEAKSESWLTRSWRPITMLTFLGLITAHYLGFTPKNLDQQTVSQMLDIIKIGLGGYIVGRSVEKTVKYLRK